MVDPRRVDFISKCSIACKEAHETLYGLDLLVARGMMKESGVSNLIRECDEIVANSTTIVKRSREHRSCFFHRSAFTVPNSPLTRHSLATHWLEAGYDIGTMEELLGPKDMSTSLIRTHVPNRGPSGVRSPVAALRHHCGGFYGDPHKTPS